MSFLTFRAKSWSIVIFVFCMCFSVQGAWQTTFEDNFDGTTLDATKWNPTGWVDNDYELQNYKSQNVEISGGTCKLWIKKESYNGKEYTSGKITTGTQSSWKFSQKYGRFECRMKLPKGKAMWPAFWLLPANPYSWPPEIDILETWGFSNTSGPTRVVSGVWCAENADCSGNSAGKAEAAMNPAGDPSDDFHTYALEWDSTRFTFFYDNQTIGTTTQYVSQYTRNMWVILQLALCGQSWGGGPPDAGTVFPASLEIDYVKVSKWANATNVQPKVRRSETPKGQSDYKEYSIRGQLIATGTNQAVRGVTISVPKNSKARKSALASVSR